MAPIGPAFGMTPCRNAHERALATVLEHRDSIEAIAELLRRDLYVSGEDVGAMWNEGRG